MVRIIRMREPFSFERASKALRYDPYTGNLFWRIYRSYNAVPGNIAGRRYKGRHVLVQLDGHKVPAHRVVWLIHYGKWPKQIIDHINGDATDNRIENLRLADYQMNAANSKVRSDNTTGLKGVYRTKYPGRWRAAICVMGKQIHIGTYDTKEAAASAYLTEAEKYFGEFTRAA